MNCGAKYVKNFQNSKSFLGSFCKKMFFFLILVDKKYFINFVDSIFFINNNEIAIKYKGDN